MNLAFLKFCLVGGFVFVVDYTALGFFRLFLPEIVSVALAYPIGVAVHFSLNKWWVFRTQANVRVPEVTRYVLSVAVCWVCTVSVAWIALRWFTSNVFVARFCAIPPAAVLSFLLMRRFVFR